MERGRLFTLMVIMCSAGGEGTWSVSVSAIPPVTCVPVTLQQITVMFGETKHDFKAMGFKHEAWL